MDRRLAVWYEASGMLRLIAISCASVLTLSGCGLLKVKRPQYQSGFKTPDSWVSASQANKGKAETGWLKSLGDPNLLELTQEALNNNNDLGVAAVRLQSAKEGTILGRATRFPAISIGGSGSRTRNKGTDTFELQGNDPNYFSNFGLTLAASWEIDLWGRLRNLDRAAYEDFVAAEADFRSARLSLAANTAKSWFNLITAQQLLDLAEKTRDSYISNYRITERNYKAGDVTATPLDVQFGRNNVASAERNLINRKLARTEAARPLEVLMGRYPGGELKSGNKLPTLRERIPAGIPSELLLRRPDIVAAAASIRASAQRADATRKDLLPSFSLTGRGSTSSNKLDRFLLDPEEIVWSSATSLAQTLFRLGAKKASARIALQQNESAIRNFASQMLRALREVESALATERSLVEQTKFLTIELRQAELAERQAGRDYSEGLIGILSVLEAQRRAVASRRAMIFLKNQRLQNRIDLHLALGGDFETMPELAPDN